VEHRIHPVLQELSLTRRHLLDLLKARGEATALELAVELELTSSAVRQQLDGLKADGLVFPLGSASDEGRRGRPSVRWRLSVAADALYPRAYADLTNELLGYVEGSSPELVDAIFRQRRDRRIESARARLAGLAFDERIAELARILDEDGYLADWSRDEDAYLVTERNCAIVGVAERYRQACGSEMEFIRAVLPEASVERVTHIVSGGLHCTYRVQLRETAEVRT
jgi:DeoR family suf operon transcriptional repressor